MKKKLLSLLLIFSIAIQGCITASKEIKEDSSGNKVVENNTPSENNNSEAKDTPAEKPAEKPEEKETNNTQTPQGQYIVTSLYKGDSNAEKVEKFKELKIKSEASINDKLTYLASELSKEVFSGLEIKIESIKDENGKKIAVINLIENEEFMKATDDSKYKFKSWSNNFFQGSAGGGITSKVLKETFLQRDLKAEWIDGIRFLYNGGEVGFQHVESLSRVSYR